MHRASFVRIISVMNVNDALDYWQEKKLLTAQKAKELKSSLPTTSEQTHSRAIGIFSVVGSVLVGLGVILFVASHWAEMTPMFKTALLLITMLVTGGLGYWLGYEKKSYEKTGLALLFINVLVFGATIFLVAQIYHLPLDFWWGALLWFLGTAFFAYVLQSRLHLWLSVPLLILFLGWLRTSYSSVGEANFIFNEHTSILPLLGVLGFCLISVSILHNRSTLLRFGRDTLFHWGTFLLLLLLVLSTLDKSIFFTFFRYPLDPIGISLLVCAVLAGAAALIAGNFRTLQGKAALLGLFLYLLFIAVIAYVPQWMGLISSTPTYDYYYDVYSSTTVTGLYILHVLLVFVFILTIIWFGTLLRRAAVINMAIFAIAVAIIIQYFSWVFGMFDRSFAFILGGLLILALGFFLERQRRKLLLTTLPA